MGVEITPIVERRKCHEKDRPRPACPDLYVGVVFLLQVTAKEKFAYIKFTTK